MKLEIDAIQALGDSEIILPQYMTALKQEEIDEIRSQGKNDRIIAFGYRKSDESFMMIDFEGMVKEVRVKEFFKQSIPIDNALPISQGKTIEINTPLIVIEVDAIDFLSASKPVNASDFEIDMRS